MALDPHINPQTGVWDDSYYATIGQYGGSSGNATYDAQKATEDAKVEKAYQQLMSAAQGDYDYAAKWIEAQYRNAVGTDDQATKDLLKQVASTLEEKNGRLAYDYTTGKYQIDTTYNTGTTRATDAQTLALSRLSQDEATSMADLKRQTTAESSATMSNLNQRGLVNGSRDTTSGLGGDVINNQNIDFQARQDAITRAAQRGTQDVNIGTSNTLQDLSWAKQLGMENLDTTTRRGIIDAQQTEQQKIEAAALQKKKDELAAQQARISGLSSNLTYAKAINT